MLLSNKQKYKLICFSTLALLLQICGFSSPWWFFCESSSFTFSIGIWYGLYCFSNRKCEAITHSSLSVLVDSDVLKNYTKDVFEDMWMEYRIESSVGLVAAVVAEFILVVVVTCDDKPLIRKLIAFGISTFTSTGVISLVPVGNAMRLHTDLMSNDVANTFKIQTPYSVLLTAFGAIVELIVAAMLCQMLCKGEPVVSINAAERLHPPPASTLTTSLPVRSVEAVQSFPMECWTETCTSENETNQITLTFPDDSQPRCWNIIDVEEIDNRQ